MSKNKAEVGGFEGTYWDFIGAVFAKQPREDQLKKMRRAYYAGALSLLRVIGDDRTSETDNMEFLSKMLEEAKKIGLED